MDPFTQRMLERAKIRREKLNNHFAEEEKSFKTALVENKENNTNFGQTKNETLKLEANKQDHSSVRKMKLKKLALFYAGEKDLSLEENNSDVEDLNYPVLEEKHSCKLGGLAELTHKINQWENETNYSKNYVSSTSNINQCSQKSKEACNLRKENEKILNTNSPKNNDKITNVFQSSRSVNNFMENIKLSKYHEHAQDSKIPVSSKVAFFESSNPKNLKIQAKDPAELSLAERKALFENNVISRNKSSFNSRQFSSSECSKSVSEHQTKIRPRVKISDDSTKIDNKTDDEIFSNEFNNLSKKTNRQEVKNEFIAERPNENKMVKESLICSPKIDSNLEKTVEKKKKPLLNSDNTHAFKSSEDSLDLKNINHEGRLYPSLSNLNDDNINELTNAEADLFKERESNDCHLNMSLTNLLEMNKNNPVTPPDDLSFSNSKEYRILNKMDKLLESALNNVSSEFEDDSYDTCSSPSKIMKSYSFEYKNNESSDSPLLHTVSFYRKQQQNNILFEKKEHQIDVIKEDQGILVQNKIEMLLTEVNKQQTIMSQASQALNLCLSTVEFSNSGEQVEGERLLLLASHKRQACLNEIQRLKIENKLWNEEGSIFSEKGDLILANISIKLKRDALRAMAASENLQYFLCLIKSDERVFATPVVAAIVENLKDYHLFFPGSIKLEGLNSNFRVTVEVYSIKLNKELLPHEVKYHLYNKKDKKLLTPIKIKKNESRLVKPHVQSPAGPSAIRTSSFQMCGYVVFSLKEINRNQWTLNKVPFVSSLEGSLSMNISSQLHLNMEFRGFLTMFDDISGFGAWHRRWCLLSSYSISFWQYPDDEQKKVPIGIIDLRSVITENVSLVSRDVCARLNTFLLETTRPTSSGDENSLVLRVQEGITTIRHLLSADSKQDMMTWCEKLNTILALLRSWKSNFDGSEKH